MLSLVIGTVLLPLPVVYLLTGLVRRYALYRGIVDVPNARSSHTQVTPRGGGLAIAFVVLSGTAVLGVLKIIPPQLALALCGGGLFVAWVGWLDDRHGLSNGIRAIVQIIAAGWALVWLGGLPRLQYGFGALSLGVLGSAIALVGIVWMINLYNFMDGIDGIAASEACVVSFSAGILLLANGKHGLAAVSFLVATSAAGFLAWNWPPAKIFMGDVSSGLLGFVFATLAIFSERTDSLPALTWVLLLGVFVVDATATLVRRIMRGERCYEAHRSHAYQLAVLSGYNHRQVTGSVIVIDSLLAFVAWVAWRWPTLLLPLVVVAMLALLWLWHRFTVLGFRKAGEVPGSQGVRG